MTNLNRPSTSRLAAGAILLMLAATASGCGVAMPTQPDLGASATMQRSATAATFQDTDGVLVIDDATNPAGGADITNAPPAGEEIVPTPSSVYPGNSSWGHSRRRHNK